MDNIGRYRLIEPVNRGQSSALWKGYDDDARKPVGIKTLLDETARNTEQIRLLKHEYQVGSLLRHPRLIDCIEFDWHNKVPYFVMEWFPSVNLKKWINRGYETYCQHIPVILIQTAEALAYLHERNWVHRDVKPDNFLFDPETGSVKAIDFAITNQVVSGFMRYFTPKQRIQGTASYLSPEQIRGLPPEFGMDIYSLGCSFYELLTQRLLFAGESMNDLLTKHLTADPPPVRQRNTNVTPEFAALLAQMLAKQSADRPKNGMDLLQALQSIKIFRTVPSAKDIR